MKKAFKFVWLFLFIISACLSFVFASDDSGESAFDFVGIACYIITGVFGLLSSVCWYSYFKMKNGILSMFLILLPVGAAIAIFIVKYFTYEKINKEYYKHFYNPGNSSRNYHYYFRVDSTVKVVGQYFMGTGYDFSFFKTKGDTIIITKPYTDGFQVQRYLSRSNTEAQPERDVLIPLNDHGERVDSLNILIEIKSEEYDY